MDRMWEKLSEAERQAAIEETGEWVEEWTEAENKRLDAIPNPFLERYGERQEWTTPPVHGRAEREG